MDSLESAKEVLVELQSSAPSVTWRTKWQAACEFLWDSLADEQSAAVPCVESFIQLLKDKSRFALARDVIVDLRGTTEDAASPHHRKILQELAPLRCATHKTLNRRQHEYDDALYKEEKARLAESERIHLTRVILHDTEGFGSELEEAMAQWWAAAPIDLDAVVKRHVEK